MYGRRFRQHLKQAHHGSVVARGGIMVDDSIEENDFHDANISKIVMESAPDFLDTFIIWLYAIGEK